MNIVQKLEQIQPHIDSIATHTDEDAAYRKAALDQVIARCEAAKVEVQAEIDARIEGLGTPE